ncbi:hypothetical protein [Paraburkholderia rhizosphaerae]|uniref:Uncharacterized protein n=1 Tax=Paraburkholderia rhizosphaerae TaxID=480658 RepID=A0A4R8L507_9BURK|nr:hypothetical protein [Paraburkholderia rhizosphaerae]TDY37385.1 hypothetical protein BX592_13828 [Paraburkholderia rhizosphaerae]
MLSAWSSVSSVRFTGVGTPSVFLAGSAFASVLSGSTAGGLYGLGVTSVLAALATFFARDVPTRRTPGRDANGAPRSVG